jgi:hypothetical protein
MAIMPPIETYVMKTSVATTSAVSYGIPSNAWAVMPAALSWATM